MTRDRTPPLPIKFIQWEGDSCTCSEHTINGNWRNVRYIYTYKKPGSLELTLLFCSILILSTTAVHYITFCHFCLNHSSFHYCLFDHQPHISCSVQCMQWHTSAHFIVPLKQELEREWFRQRWQRVIEWAAIVQKCLAYKQSLSQESWYVLYA